MRSACARALRTFACFAAQLAHLWHFARSKCTQAPRTRKSMAARCAPAKLRSTFARALGFARRMMRGFASPRIMRTFNLLRELNAPKPRRRANQRPHCQPRCAAHVRALNCARLARLCFAAHLARLWPFARAKRGRKPRGCANQSKRFAAHVRAHWARRHVQNTSVRAKEHGRDAARTSHHAFLFS